MHGKDLDHSQVLVGNDGFGRNVIQLQLPGLAQSFFGRAVFVNNTTDPSETVRFTSFILMLFLLHHNQHFGYQSTLLASTMQ